MKNTGGVILCKLIRPRSSDEYTASVYCDAVFMLLAKCVVSFWDAVAKVDWCFCVQRWPRTYYFDSGGAKRFGCFDEYDVLQIQILVRTTLGMKHKRHTSVAA